MAETGIRAFDTTLNKTHAWLHEIMEELGTKDRQRAYLALRSTLHALRDRLPPEEAVELGAQLPMLVRGFYYEGWKPSATPRRERTQQQFLEHVRHDFPEEGDFFPERAARAVLKVLGRHVTHGEIRAVKHLLPEPIQELFR
jgi:uncharacterized protein (DUF2267 family)